MFSLLNLYELRKGDVGAGTACRVAKLVGRGPGRVVQKVMVCGVCVWWGDRV